MKSRCDYCGETKSGVEPRYHYAGWACRSCSNGMSGSGGSVKLAYNQKKE